MRLSIGDLPGCARSKRESLLCFWQPMHTRAARDADIKLYDDLRYFIFPKFPTRVKAKVERNVLHCNTMFDVYDIRGLQLEQIFRSILIFRFVPVPYLIYKKLSYRSCPGTS